MSRTKLAMDDDFYNDDDYFYYHQVERVEEGKKWAKENGYNRLRLTEVEHIEPNFIKAINI